MIAPLTAGMALAASVTGAGLSAAAPAEAAQCEPERLLVTACIEAEDSLLSSPLPTFSLKSTSPSSSPTPTTTASPTPSPGTTTTTAPAPQPTAAPGTAAPLAPAAPAPAPQAPTTPGPVQGATTIPVPSGGGQVAPGRVATDQGLPASGGASAEPSPSPSAATETPSPSASASARASRARNEATPDDGHVATSQVTPKPLEISPGPVMFAAAGLLLTSISGVGLYRWRAANALERRLTEESGKV